MDQEDEIEQELPCDQGVVELGDDSGGEEGLILVTRKILLATKIEDVDWLKDNIFYTTCSINAKICNLIIDGGSCENVVSQEEIDKLGLQTSDHPTPYKLSWLKKGSSVKVEKRCLISFSIRKQFHDEVLCDVVKMDACHLLLGRPWQHDRSAIHDGKRSSYSLTKDGQRYNLLPMKKTSKSLTPNSLLVNKSFVKESMDLEKFYMLFSTLELNSMPIPTKIKHLMTQFDDVFPKELPNDLPPMRDI